MKPPGNRRVSRPPEAPPSEQARGEVGAAQARTSPRPRDVVLARCVAVARAVAGGALVVALSFTVAWAVRRYVVQSPRFAIQDLTVDGQKHRTADALLELAGLTRGANIFSVELDRARARLMSDPWISDATIERRLPGTLRVRVVEREPAALVSLRRLYLVARDGEIFKSFELGDPTDLPLVTGLDPDAMLDDREGTKSTLLHALDLAGEYERTPLGSREVVQEIHVNTDGGFTFVVGRDGLTLAFGSAPFKRKIDQAERVVAELDRRHARAKVVMLDDEARPERVVVRLR